MKYNVSFLCSFLFLASFFHLIYSMDSERITEIIATQMYSDELEKEHKKSLKDLLFKDQRPHETLVTIWNENHIKMQPAIITPQILASPILADCIATVFLTQYNNGEQCAAMTQYPIASQLKHINKIEELCATMGSTQTESKKIIANHFFVVMPCDIIAPLLMRNEYGIHYMLLIKLVTERFKEIKPVQTHLILYDTTYDRTNEANDHRALEVILYPDKATVIARSGSTQMDFPINQ